MAKLIPAVDPAEIKNESERKMAYALINQLPKGIEVFHSFRWLRRVKGHLEEGEADFVILDPKNGLLFVEVKGGWLRFDPEQMAWFRTPANGPMEELRRSPFDQAADSMHFLMDRIGRESAFAGRPGPALTYGFAVAFPGCRCPEKLPPNITADLVWDADKCKNLCDAVTRTFEQWRRRVFPPLGTREKEAIYSALFPRFGILPVLWSKVEDQEDRLRRLTDDQQRLLEFMSGQRKAAIQGVAGSGKTILALAKAQAAARQGMQTLLICYNTPLSEWLDQTIPESLRPNLKVETFQSLVSGLCKKAQVAFNPFASRQDGRDPWKDIAPERLMDACDLLPIEDKYDAVIVDEGQDFHDLWWTALEGTFRDPANKGCYYVFFDPNQNISVEKPSVPDELGQPFVLPVNCRNTARIAEHCSSLINEPSRVREGAPTGDEPELIKAPNPKSAWQMAGRKVREWCMHGTGGLDNSQVSVLASGSTEKDWPENFGTVKATRNFDQWRKNDGVLMASWSRFKGLEADAIVIVETPDDDHVKYRYVARSRAKHILTIVQICQS